MDTDAYNGVCFLGAYNEARTTAFRFSAFPISAFYFSLPITTHYSPLTGKMPVLLRRRVLLPVLVGEEAHEEGEQDGV